ncbi:MAG TPA: FAD-dependent oxidoreductase [Leeuwenhoekiella sp.]|nr:FAD-dependent oxidoreductase [Leeuwenhoekiella sp.]
MREKEINTVHILGAGISGLIAALVLEEKGYAPVIYEVADRVGGRVKTDIYKGYQLDHGFQILLGAYPKAKQYLDYEALELQEILPGAVIFSKGKKFTLGDPLRAISFLWPTLSSSVATIGDKLKILRLYLKLKNKTLTEIFEDEERTTFTYLKEFGFSDRMINQFFKPFFTGIFLEPHLETSSRMFEYVFKLFGEGSAMLPKNGIAAIPEQLKNKLKQTTFKFNTTVEKVEEEAIYLSDGSKVYSKNTIIATTANNLVSNLRNQGTQWKSCINFYFETAQRKIDKPIIGLIADENALINNIFYHNSIKTGQKGARELLSVTIVKPNNLDEKQLLERVISDLKNYCGIVDATFLKRYTIKKALPDLPSLNYELAPTETQLTSGIFLAGDQLLNGSLNAAMISGERAALVVIKKMEGGTITG